MPVAGAQDGALRARAAPARAVLAARRRAAHAPRGHRAGRAGEPPRRSRVRTDVSLQHLQRPNKTNRSFKKCIVSYLLLTRDKYFFIIF